MESTRSPALVLDSNPGRQRWDNGEVDPKAATEYCSFTKAIEHLGDRWNLLIVRELGMRGPKGFSELAADLPGHISRSVLTTRLRRLVTLGLVAPPPERESPRVYRLTAAGSGLVPTLDSLRMWSCDWLPEDPAMVEDDPDIVLGWLARRADAARLPSRPAVLEISVLDGATYWLVLDGQTEPYGCLTDPALDPSRYVYIAAALPTVLALARGRRGWDESLTNGSVLVSGPPGLIAQLPTWFARTEATRARPRPMN
jgi:DNA-binding HxlR family transcriptional regulator